MARFAAVLNHPKPLSVFSSQGESAPKWSKLKARSFEVDQMTQESSNCVPWMALDTQYASHDSNCADRVCNAVFSRSFQKLKRFLLTQISQMSMDVRFGLLRSTFAIREVLMSLPIEFGKENTEFEIIGPQQKSGFSESQKSGFWTKIALTEEQIGSEISSLRHRTHNPFKFG